MKKLLITAALLGLVATPAFATGHGGASSSNVNVNKNSSASKATSSSHSKATAVNRSNQQVRSTNAQGQGQGQSQDDSTNVEGSWGFSYVDVPTTVPQAVATDNVVVLSDSWKVGPLFGHSSQDVIYLPASVAGAYINVLVARGVAVPSETGVTLLTGQENFQYEAAFAMQTVLCTKDPATAKQLLLSCVE